MPDISFGSPTVSGNIQVVTEYQPTSADTTTGTATGRTDTYTVGAGKKWLLKGVYYSRANAAVNSTRLEIDSTVYVIDESASATTHKVEFNDIWLKAGDSVKMQFNTGASGSLISYIFYEEHTA